MCQLNNKAKHQVKMKVETRLMYIDYWISKVNNAKTSI